jgi:hypothetical protein
MPCEGCSLEHRKLEQMEPIPNFQVPAEVLELVILLHTQYYLGRHKSIANDDSHPKYFCIILLIISNFL